MREPIITVENLSKKYTLGTQRQSGDGLRHILDHAIRSSFRKRKSHSANCNSDVTEFWALKDINLQLQQGEIVGVIGRNGAGKSTLLKLLSRITEPTNGRIKLNGRVACLLEVGTGFHPELTGRENIFLNGAILGMSRIEIKHKFNQITEFAEIGKFLDTPVKRYSSGMYVRLAFAVAAHLEPEILIVDEVLAVGDTEFQQKCLGKMGDFVSKEGKTVIFVSHQLPAVQHLCQRCILLENGTIGADGLTATVISNYLATAIKLSGCLPGERIDRIGRGEIRLTRISIANKKVEGGGTVISGDSLAIRFWYSLQVGKVLNDCVFCVAINQNLRTLIKLSSGLVDRRKITLMESGYVEFFIPDLPLAGGRYHIDFYVESEGIIQDCLDDAGTLDVEDGDYFRSGVINHQGCNDYTVLVRHSFRKS
jgi:lipopolysaccharide transport system ATP-binding protein